MLTESGQFFTAGGGYEIDQSIRFNEADTAYLIRTPGSAGNQKTWTWSGWVKFCVNTDYNILFGTGGLTGTANDFVLHFDADPVNNYKLSAYRYSQTLFRTSAHYRDPSAWYHIVWSLDTTSGTADNRNRLYVNGSEVTSFSTAKAALTLNGDYPVNSTTAHGIARGASAGYNFDGYMAEINFIDGQALDPTSFGETNDDGVWIPKAYEGTYGTNGFYITGEDSADLGADYSGNGNDFTSSGLTADNQVTDTPTLNYCTLSPLSIAAFTGTFSEGNLRLVVTANDLQFGTMFPQTGKWFFEVYVTDANNSYIGIIPETNANGEGNSLGYRNGAMLNTVGDIFIPSADSTKDGSPSWGDGVRVGVAYDVDNHLVWWSIDGQWYSADDGTEATIAITEVEAGNQGYDFSALGGKGYAPCIAASTVGGDCTLNTGNPTASFIDATTNSDGNGYGLFADTVPSGFLALNTANLPTPTVADGSKHFQTTLYTGNGTAIGSGGLAVSQSENSTFQPDLVWIKRRNASVQHAITDAMRGVTKELNSDDLIVESTVAEGLTTFGSSGFTVGSDASYNTNAAPYVAWQWLAGNGTTSNTDGSITTTTSVNLASGISIMTYTGNATAGATIGHGLGAKPGLVIAKSRGTADRWWVYHEDQGATKYGMLELSNAFGTASIYWNNTEPDSSVITLGTGQTNVTGGSMLAYAFIEIPGFSRISAYKANGNADGAFIYTGFKPAWLMIKRTNSTSSWGISDTKRLGYNVDNDFIMADTIAGEVTYDYVDLLSNGFKVRNSGTAVGVSGGNYVYMAFAEHPFGGDGVAPVPAR